MTALAIIAKALVLLAAGFVVLRALQFGDEAIGRVTSWPRFRRSDQITRATLRRFQEPDPDAGILGHSPEAWERSTRRGEEER